ncbi:MAG: hypothetical protein ACPG8W_03850 [Candidatus Promineifilaceae bacterium]
MSNEQTHSSRERRANGFKWVILGCLILLLAFAIYQAWPGSGISAEIGPQLTAFEPIEGTKVRLIGTGTAGQELRVIINQQREERAQVDENGDWSVETTAFGQTGRYDIQVDDLDADNEDPEAIPVSIVVKDSNISSFDVPTLNLSVMSEGEDADIAVATQIPTPIPTLIVDEDELDLAVEPELLLFRANVSNAKVGDTVQLLWDTTAENGLVLQLVDDEDNTLLSQPVAASGDQAIEIIEPWGNFITARIQDTTGTISSETQISIDCAISWSVSPEPSRCPNAQALASRATHQVFEGGIMIWVQDLDRIFIIPESGQSWLVEDQFKHDVHPVLDESLDVPEDRQQPMWGFGKVWREDEAIQNALGWALSESIDYQTRYQCEQVDVCFLTTIDGEMLVPQDNTQVAIESDWTLNLEETP